MYLDATGNSTHLSGSLLVRSRSRCKQIIASGISAHPVPPKIESSNICPIVYVARGQCLRQNYALYELENQLITQKSFALRGRPRDTRPSEIACQQAHNWKSPSTVLRAHRRCCGGSEQNPVLGTLGSACCIFQACSADATLLR